MSNEIGILVELGRAERLCSRLLERTESIPRELERHQAELVLLKAALAEQQRNHDDLQRERRALERDAEVSKSRRRELEQQQFRVKNNTEYQALMREIEEMKRRTAEVEEQALKMMADEETAQGEIRRLQEQADQEERKVAGVRDRLESELADYRKQLEVARAARDDLARRLSPSLRTRYERILRSKGDMAVVAVEQGACVGCGYQLPPQRLVELHKRERMVMCEGCGRMLVVNVQP